MSNLAELVRTAPKKPERAARGSAAKKTLLDRTLEAFDREVADFNAGKKYESERAARRAWFKDIGEEVSVTVKAGNTALSLMDGKTTLYTDRKNFKQVAKLLRQNLASGEYAAEMADIEKSFVARAQNRKPRAPKA